MRLWALGEVSLRHNPAASPDDEGDNPASTGEQHVLAGLAAIGLVPDAPVGHGQEELVVWPENLFVLKLFMSLQTQWRVGTNGPVGLDRSEMEKTAASHSRTARRMGVASSKHELLAYFKAMEVAALEGWSQRSDNQAQSANH